MFPLPGLGALVVGGKLRRFETALNSPGDQWTRFGSGLPNAVVDELDYNATDDILVAGTFGRGVYSVDNASIVVEEVWRSNICGDEDHVNQDDVITLIRNAMNPLIWTSS